ncbi:MAG: hypothetical protein ISS52_07255 [Dehalococcoidia bacterium]|nr:hypothetical protein [Dehalococcoidia bacterium]
MSKLKGWESLSVLIVLVLLLPLAAALMPTSTVWAVADNVTPGRASPGGGVTGTQSQTPPDMMLAYMNVTPQQILAGEPVTIMVNVSNSGGTTGSHTVVLMINGQQEETRLVTVGAQSAQPEKFIVTRDVPGTYKVTIGNQQAEFTVLGTSTAGSPVSGALIIAIVIGIVLIASVVVLFLRRRPAY